MPACAIATPRQTDPSPQQESIVITQPFSLKPPSLKPLSLKPLSLKPFFLAALLGAAAAGTTANAAITVYTSQSSFLAAVSSAGTDSFNDLTVDSLGDSLNRTAGAYSYTASAATGLYGAGVTGDTWLSTNSRFDPIVFSGFTPGVSAFGGNFFASDIGGNYVASGTLLLTASDGTTLNTTLNGATQGSFLGFISDTGLNTVMIEASPDGAYWPTANNVVLAVPEPATYGMFMAGLGLFGFAARRRRG
jgi:hypothetical protein